MPHPIETYLETNSIESLKEEPYNLSIKEDQTENGKKVWVIDYDQIRSPRFHYLVDECRGIVVCQESKKVVCYPFSRFYNMGEDKKTEEAFDWSTAKCLSKEDGSLIKVYYYDNNWRIATRGTAFGNNNVFSMTQGESSITFKNLFLRALGISHEEFQAHMNAASPIHVNWLFELCTQDNKVVKLYETDKVFVLSARATDGNYCSDFSLANLNVHFPTYYNLSSFDACKKAVNKLEGLTEGFVLVDGNNRRLKLKSIKYVAAHHMISGPLTPKKAVDLILAGEKEEFISYVDDFDVDEQIMTFRQDKRYCADFTLRQSVHDFEEFETLLKDVVDKLNNLPQKA